MNDEEGRVFRRLIYPEPRYTPFNLHSPALLNNKSANNNGGEGGEAGEGGGGVGIKFRVNEAAAPTSRYNRAPLSHRDTHTGTRVHA